MRHNLQSLEQYVLHSRAQSICWLYEWPLARIPGGIAKRAEGLQKDCLEGSNNEMIFGGVESGEKNILDWKTRVSQGTETLKR